MHVTTVSAKLLEPVLQLARHFRQPSGQDLQKQILEIAALPEQEFTKPGARFPAARYPAVLETLAVASNNPLIALNLGEATQPRMLGSIGFLMSTAQTLELAYQTLIDYLPLLFEGAVLQMEQTVEGTQLTLELNHNDPRAVEYFLACLINWPRWLTGHQVPARAVHLTLPEPENIQPYQQFFAAEVTFGAPRNQLMLSSDYLSLICLDANSEMHQLHREFADSLLSKTALQNALTAQTRNLIRQQLAEGGGSVRREQIAASVGLSLRTLQRKLGQQGSSFQDIYDQTRREVCLQLIQRGQMSFGEIAFQLGFSNQSAFQKAFKRWMGMAPSEYRQQVKPAEIDAIAVQTPPTQDVDWLQGDDRELILKQKLRSLSHFSRELLEWAAISGHIFDLNQLTGVTGDPLARLAIHFWPAEQTGLIIALNDNEDKTRYCFANDEIWTHIYEHIQTDDRQQRHQRYGESLHDTLPANAGLERISEILLHLEQSPVDTCTPNAVHQRLKLTLDAAALARQVQDYRSASRYMSIASRLPELEGLPSIKTRKLQCADLLLLAGDITEAEHTIDTLRISDLSVTEAGQTALIRARIYQHQGQYADALQYLLEQLIQLDLPLPDQANDQLSLLLKQLTFITAQFSAQALTEMEESTDDQQHIRLQLLEQVSLLARQQSQPLLSACAIGRMTELSLHHGRTPQTAFAFVSYAWVASWFCADFSLAQTFSAQGMQLASRFGGVSQQGNHLSTSASANLASSAALIHSSQVQHWFTPLEKVQEQLEQIESLTGSEGQWLQQSECRLLQAQLNLFSAKPLKEQREDLQLQHQQMLDQQQRYQAERLQGSVLSLIDQLTDQQPLSLAVEYKDGWQAVSTIISALLLDQQHLWPQFYPWEAALENELAGYFSVSEALFCTAMMRLIQAQQQQALSHRRRQEVAHLESRLEIWARHCPENFNGQLYLLKAELARLNDQSPGRYFEQALNATERQNFSFHRALIYERYADYLSADEQNHLARFCLNEARWFYEQWGADAKLKQLAQRLALLAK